MLLQFRSHVLADIGALNTLTSKIIGAGTTVHRRLGPGLLHSAYVPCLAHEIRKVELGAKVDVVLPLIYDELHIPSAYKIDLLVEGKVIIEVKCVTALAPVHRAQLLTYLKLTDLPVGLLMNFHVPILKEGIRRVLNTAGKDGSSGVRS